MKKFLKAFFSGLSPKEKKLLIITVVIITLALFDRLIMMPLLQEAKTLEEKISTQTALIYKNLLILNYKEKILNESELYVDYYTSADLIPEQLTASFLSDVEQIAKKANLTLTNITSVEVKEEKKYKKYQVIIEGTGSFENFLAFIYGMTNVNRPLSVESVDFAPQNRKTQEIKFRATINKMVISPATPFNNNEKNS